MKRAIWILTVVLGIIAAGKHCDVCATDTLELLGQTRGGSAFRTEFAQGRLYAGVGAMSQMGFSPTRSRGFIFARFHTR